MFYDYHMHCSYSADSHNPGQVAFNFEYVHNILMEIGYKYVCRFDKMNIEFIKL